MQWSYVQNLDTCESTNSGWVIWTTFQALKMYHGIVQLQGLLDANVAFEIVISRSFGISTKFGGAIKSGVLIQW
jgi:hypothetical protein